MTDYMKWIRRIFLGIVALLLVFIVAAFAIPYFFKDQIVAVVKEEVNKNVHATVDFSDADLSLIRNFPRISLRLTDVKVTGMDEFEGVRLASLPQFDLAFYFWSVIKADQPIGIHSIGLTDPDIHVVVLKNGKANYDIALPSTDTVASASTPFEVSLQSYGIKNGHLVYDDRSAEVYAELTGLNHKGSGNFTNTLFDIDTETKVDALTAVSGGITYLSKAAVQLDAVIGADLDQMLFTLKDNDAMINALRLLLEGSVQIRENDYLLDLAFKAPENDFKHFLSLIPNAYTQGYENVKATGRFALAGQVKGAYDINTGALPAFNLDMQIENGQVQYPDLPMAIEQIAADIKVNSPSSNLDKMTVDVPQLNLVLGNNPFNIKFHLKTPVSNPDVDAAAKGKINLADFVKAYPVEGIEELSGIIDADVVLKASLADLERQAVEDVNVAGTLAVANLMYRAAGTPPVNIPSLSAKFSPAFIDIPAFQAILGKSDLSGRGRIDNFLAYFSPEKTMKGDFALQSKLLDLNEWMATSVDTTAVADTGEPAAKPFDRFDFTADFKADKILYDQYTLTNTAATGHLTSNDLNLSNFNVQIGDSDLKGSGAITGMYGYLFDGDMLGGNIQLNSNYLNLNQFMVEEGQTAPTAEAAAAAELEPVLVPANVQIDIDADIKKLVYTNLEINQLKGELKVADQAVVIEDATAAVLGGQVAMSGGYSTVNPEEPEFSLKYDFKDMDFRRSFETFNTFQALAPIAKFLQGKFSTSLIMDGKLGKDLMPKWNSLNAQGFLETFNAALKQFKPIEAVANAMNVEELKALTLDSKNWFEVKDGRVEVKPFDLKYKGIDMQIAGFHAITQDMSYNIKAKVPRKMLASNPVGAAASQGFDLLGKEAAKLGINLQQSEFVNVLVELTGSISDPKVKLKLLNSEGTASVEDAVTAKAKEEVEKAKDKLESEAQKVLDEQKQKAQEVITKAADTITNVVRDQAGKVIDKATEEVKDKAGQVLKEEAGKKAGEVLGDKGNAVLDTLLNEKAKESVDDIKKKLENWNPFQKKQKN